MATINPGDKFIVNRNSQSHQFEAIETMAEIQENDLMLINRSNKSYSITGLEVLDSLKQKEPTIYRIAKGSISDGHTVCLNDDDTVSEVSGNDSSAALSSPPYQYTTGSAGGPGASAYDPVNDKYLFTYVGPSNWTYAIVGTRDSNGVYTFGTPETIYNGVSSRLSLAYIPEHEVFYVGYVYGSGQSYTCHPLRVKSDSTIELGTGNNVDPGGNQAWVWSQPHVIYDSNSQRVLTCFSKYAMDYTLSRGRPIVRLAAFRYDSETDRFEDKVIFDVDQQGETEKNIGSPQFVHDTKNNKIVITYSGHRPGSFGTEDIMSLIARVGRLSANGNSTTFDYGERQYLIDDYEFQFRSNEPSIYYDPDNSIVAQFGNLTEGQRYEAWYSIFKANSSNNNLEVINELTIFDFVKSNHLTPGYDPSCKKGIISYTLDDTRDTIFRGFIYAPAIKRLVFEDSVPNDIEVNGSRSNWAYNPTTQTNTIAFQSQGNGTVENEWGTYVVEFSPDKFNSNASADNFIGFSNGAYNNGEMAEIHTHMALNSAQSGLTADAQYYLQGDGSIDTEPANATSIIKAGIGVSANSIRVKLN